MPCLVACPSCGAKLKSSRPIPVGRALACPHCKSQFTLADPALEVVDPKPAAPPPSPAPPPLPARPATPFKHSAEIPDAVILDDPVNDRPRGPAVDFDFDDDRPLPKRRAYREGGAECDRARRRRAKKKGSGLLIGGGGGAAALLFLGGGGAVVYFADPFGLRRGPASDEMLGWAPADSQSIIYVDA